MAVVKINALEFPDGEGAELERRFAARRNAMNDVPGCLGFQLWRPVAGEQRYFVTTQWESDEAYRAWREQGMGPSHTGSGQKQVSTGASQIEFEVVDLERGRQALIPPDPERIAAAADLLRGADALLVTAGAGMGVDSGLPDFRGHEGFWRAYPAYRGLGLGFADLAGPVHFVDDPPLAWGFYGHRLDLYRHTVPHDEFAVLLRWAARWPTRAFTSNVDGQFQRAGFAGDDVAEVHGTIHHLQCLAECGQPVWPADGVRVAVDESTMRARDPLPSCPACGSLARPNILMFGDLAWDDRLIGPRLERHVEWLRGLRRSGARLAVVELGAGTAVPTVRRQSELAAATSGALVRINVREPEVRHGHGVGIPAPAAATLAALDAALGHPGS